MDIFNTFNDVMTKFHEAFDQAAQSIINNADECSVSTGKNTNYDKTNINLYADGACSGNPGPGGFCALITCDELGITNDRALCIYGGNKDTTNNKMEIKGIYEGLKAIEDLLDRQSKISKFIYNSDLYDIDILSTLESSRDINVTIYSDSSYALKSISDWIIRWERNNWLNSKGEPVKNKEIIQACHDICTCFNHVSYQWIKGHNNNRYNEKCDIIAVKAYENEIFEDLMISSIDLT